MLKKGWSLGLEWHRFSFAPVPQGCCRAGCAHSTQGAEVILFLFPTGISVLLKAPARGQAPRTPAARGTQNKAALLRIAWGSEHVPANLCRNCSCCIWPYTKNKEWDLRSRCNALRGCSRHAAWGPTEKFYYLKLLSLPVMSWSAVVLAGSREREPHHHQKHPEQHCLPKHQYCSRHLESLKKKDKVRLGGQEHMFYIWFLCHVFAIKFEARHLHTRCREGAQVF